MSELLIDSYVCSGDTDSVSISLSEPGTDAGFLRMLKKEVLNDPVLLQNFHDEKARLLSDGTIEGNLSFGRFKPERSDVAEAIFIGIYF